LTRKIANNSTGAAMAATISITGVMRS
jgi:hypothetical protein